MNTTNPDERQPDWVTDAPSDYTVLTAERDERGGISWPISGDATTIAANTP